MIKTLKIFRFWYRRSKSFNDTFILTIATLTIVGIFNQFATTREILKATAIILNKTKLIN